MRVFADPPPWDLAFFRRISRAGANHAKLQIVSRNQKGRGGDICIPKCRHDIKHIARKTTTFEEGGGMTIVFFCPDQPVRPLKCLTAWSGSLAEEQGKENQRLALTIAALLDACR